MAGKPTGKYRPEVMEFIASLEGGWVARAAACTKRFGVSYGADAMRMHCLSHGLSISDKLGARPFNMRQYMCRGRTVAEVVAKRGTTEAEAQRLINSPPAGLSLFTTRDDFNRLIHLWLPETRHEIKILPRAWRYTLCDGNPEDPAYMFAGLPALKGEDSIHVLPIFDVHFGHKAHKQEKFLSTVQWVAEHDNCFVILGGDLMENALDDGRGMSYDQAEPPETQMLELTRILAPIAHKVIVMFPGNHEERSFKRAGLDPSRYIADRLRIPYSSGPITIDLQWRGHSWLMYASHGRGNAQTKGGKLNSAGRPKVFNSFVHFILQGHVHDSDVISETVRVPDPAHRRMLHKTRYTLIAPSFLGWHDTYAYRAGYAPPAKGGLGIHLYANGEYDAHAK